MSADNGIEHRSESTNFVNLYNPDYFFGIFTKDNGPYKYRLDSNFNRIISWKHDPLHYLSSMVGCDITSRQDEEIKDRYKKIYFFESDLRRTTAAPLSKPIVQRVSNKDDIESLAKKYQDKYDKYGIGLELVPIETAKYVERDMWEYEERIARYEGKSHPPRTVTYWDNFTFINRSKKQPRRLARFWTDNTSKNLRV